MKRSDEDNSEELRKYKIGSLKSYKDQILVTKLKTSKSNLSDNNNVEKTNTMSTSSMKNEKMSGLTKNQFQHFLMMQVASLERNILETD